MAAQHSRQSPRLATDDAELSDDGILPGTSQAGAGVRSAHSDDGKDVPTARHHAVRRTPVQMVRQPRPDAARDGFLKWFVAAKEKHALGVYVIKVADLTVGADVPGWQPMPHNEASTADTLNLLGQLGVVDTTAAPLNVVLSSDDYDIDSDPSSQRLTIQGSTKLFLWDGMTRYTKAKELYGDAWMNSTVHAHVLKAAAMSDPDWCIPYWAAARNSLTNPADETERLAGIVAFCARLELIKRRMFAERYDKDSLRGFPRGTEQTAPLKTGAEKRIIQRLLQDITVTPDDDNGEVSFNLPVAVFQGSDLALSATIAIRMTMSRLQELVLHHDKPRYTVLAQIRVLKWMTSNSNQAVISSRFQSALSLVEQYFAVEPDMTLTTTCVTKNRLPPANRATRGSNYRVLTEPPNRGNKQTPSGAAADPPAGPTPPGADADPPAGPTPPGADAGPPAGPTPPPSPDEPPVESTTPASEQSPSGSSQSSSAHSNAEGPDESDASDRGSTRGEKRKRVTSADEYDSQENPPPPSAAESSSPSRSDADQGHSDDPNDPPPSKRLRVASSMPTSTPPPAQFSSIDVRSDEVRQEAENILRNVIDGKRTIKRSFSISLETATTRLHAATAHAAVINLLKAQCKVMGTAADDGRQSSDAVAARADAHAELVNKCENLRISFADAVYGHLPQAFGVLLSGKNVTITLVKDVNRAARCAANLAAEDSLLLQWLRTERSRRGALEESLSDVSSTQVSDDRQDATSAVWLLVVANVRRVQSAVACAEAYYYAKTAAARDVVTHAAVAKRDHRTDRGPSTADVKTAVTAAAAAGVQRRELYLKLRPDVDFIDSARRSLRRVCNPVAVMEQAFEPAKRAEGVRAMLTTATKAAAAEHADDNDPEIGEPADIDFSDQLKDLHDAFSTIDSDVAVSTITCCALHVVGEAVRVGLSQVADNSVVVQTVGRRPPSTSRRSPGNSTTSRDVSQAPSSARLPVHEQLRAPSPEPTTGQASSAARPARTLLPALSVRDRLATRQAALQGASGDAGLTHRTRLPNRPADDNVVATRLWKMLKSAFDDASAKHSDARMMFAGDVGVDLTTTEASPSTLVAQDAAADAERYRDVIFSAFQQALEQRPRQDVTKTEAPSMQARSGRLTYVDDTHSIAAVCWDRDDFKWTVRQCGGRPSERLQSSDQAALDDDSERPVLGAGSDRGVHVVTPALLLRQLGHGSTQDHTTLTSKRLFVFQAVCPQRYATDPDLWLDQQNGFVRQVSRPGDVLLIASSALRDGPVAGFLDTGMGLCLTTVSSAQPVVEAAAGRRLSWWPSPVGSPALVPDQVSTTSTSAPQPPPTWGPCQQHVDKSCQVEPDKASPNDEVILKALPDKVGDQPYGAPSLTTMFQMFVRKSDDKTAVLDVDAVVPSANTLSAAEQQGIAVAKLLTARSAASTLQAQEEDFMPLLTPPVSDQPLIPGAVLMEPAAVAICNALGLRAAHRFTVWNALFRHVLRFGDDVQVCSGGEAGAELILAMMASRLDGAVVVSPDPRSYNRTSSTTVSCMSSVRADVQSVVSEWQTSCEHFPGKQLVSPTGVRESVHVPFGKFPWK